MTCTVINGGCLRVGDKVPVTLDLSNVAARRWRAGAQFADGVRIRGKKAGFEFEAANDGQTGDKEPVWPKVIDGEVIDGSITWVAKAVSTDSLRKVIDDVEWEAPTGVTVSGESVNTTEQTATAYLEPTDAGTYEVIAWVTFDDNPAHREGFAVSIEAQ